MPAGRDDDAVDRVAEEAPADDLLTLLAFLAPDPLPTRSLVEGREALPKTLAEQASDTEALEAVLASLAEDGLIAIREGGVTLASPVRAALRDRMEPPRRRNKHKDAVSFLLAAFPDEGDDPANWDVCAALLPHVRAAVAPADDDRPQDEAALRLSDRAAVYLLSSGNPEEALEMLRRALERTTGDASTATGALRRTLGSVLHELDDVDAAKVEVEQALEIHINALGADHPEVIKDRTALGRILASEDDHPGALRELQQALEADERLGTYGMASCELRMALGWVRLAKEDPAGARETFADSLAIAEDRYGADHHAAAVARSGLGHVMLEKGEYSEARREFERVLTILRATLGPDHVDVATARSNLASALQGLGDLSPAREQLELALRAVEGTSDVDDAVRIRHRKLASVLHEMGDLERAEDHARRAVKIGEQEADEIEQELADDLSWLGDIQAAAGRHAAAARSYRQALDALLAASDGTDESQVAQHHALVAYAAYHAGDLRTARAHFAAAVDTYERIGDAARRSEATRARVGLAWTTAQLGEALAEGYSAAGLAQRADQVRREAREAFDATVQDVTRSANPERLLDLAEGCLEVAALEPAGAALERAGAAAGDSLSDRARLRLGVAWRRVGKALLKGNEVEHAMRAFEAAVEWLDGHPQLRGRALHDMARVRQERDPKDLTQAIGLFRRALTDKRAAEQNGETGARDVAVTLHFFARALEENNDYPEAFEMYEERLRILQSLPVRESQLEGVTLHDLGDVRRAQGDHAAAIDFYREAADRKRAAGAAGNPRDLGVTLQHLGRALEETRQYEAAIQAYEERMEILASLPARDPKAEGVTLHDLGDAKRALGDMAEAVDCYRRSAEKKRQARGVGDPIQLAITLLALAGAELTLGRHEAAGAAAQEAAELYRCRDRPRRDGLAVALAIAANAALHAGDIETALEAVEEADGLVRDAADADPGDVAGLGVLRHRVLQAADREPDAARVRDETRQVLACAIEDGAAIRAWSGARTLCGLAAAIEAWDLVSAIVEQTRTKGVVSDPDYATGYADLLLQLGHSCMDEERHDIARDLLEERLRILKSLRRETATEAPDETARARIAESEALLRQISAQQRGAAS